MVFLNPFFLAFAPLIFLPMLLSLFKTKRENKIIPSTKIWLEVVLEQKLNSPLKKYLSTLEMILQMILIALLILGLSRPSFKIKTDAKILIFVDISASLSAKNGAFARLKNTMLSTLKSFPNGAKYSLYLAGQKLHPVLVDEQNVESVISQIDLILPYPDGIKIDNISEEISAVVEMQKEKDKEKEIIAFFFTDSNNEKNELEKLQEAMQHSKVIFSLVPIANQGGNIGIFNVRNSITASGNLMINFDIGNFSDSQCEIALNIEAHSTAGDRLHQRKEFIILNKSSSKSFTKAISLRQSAKISIFFNVIDGTNMLDCDDGFGTWYSFNKNNEGVYVGSAKYYPYFKKIFNIKNWDIEYYKEIPVNIKLPCPPIWIFYNSFDAGAMKFLSKDSFFLVFGNSPFISTSSTTVQNIASFNGTHPFLRFCDFSEVTINTPYTLQNAFPELDETVLATTGNQNIISLMSSPDSGKILAFAFNLSGSNFLTTLSFPIMMENIYDYMKMKKGEVLLYYTGDTWFDAKGDLPFLKPGSERLYEKQINLNNETESNLLNSSKFSAGENRVLSKMKELFHQEIADVILYIILFFLIFESMVRFIKKRRKLK